MIMSSVFFFKQKTAYEMRISDWSSDVCSSDLLIEHFTVLRGHTDADFDFSPFAQCMDDGKHLDRFRAGPENRNNLHAIPPGHAAISVHTGLVLTGVKRRDLTGNSFADRKTVL